MTLADPDDSLVISILDQGQGISQNIIKKIEEEDLTNITRHGLGIFISKHIANLHSGKLIIENKNPGLEVSFIFDSKNNF